MPISFENNRPVLDESTFLDFQGMVYEFSGMFFDIDQRYFMEKRLSNRLASLQLNSFKDYYLYLMYDPKRDEEVSVMVDLLTTNETYFFREMFQLKAFYEEILPILAESKKGGTINIWSAGCSTGEEPYTIAMIVDHMKSRGELRDVDVDVLGSDISHRVLKAARKGLYGHTSFRGLDEKYMKYFEPEDENGKRKIKDKIREMVSFNQLNLFDTSKIMLLSEMDVIFCRNVLIYFNNDSKRKVVEAFYNKIVPGGYFLLGHSESLMNVSTIFDLQHLRNDMVYRKPELGADAGAHL